MDPHGQERPVPNNKALQNPISNPRNVPRVAMIVAMTTAKADSVIAIKDVTAMADASRSSRDAVENSRIAGVHRQARRKRLQPMACV